MSKKKQKAKRKIRDPFANAVLLGQVATRIVARKIASVAVESASKTSPKRTEWEFTNPA